MKEEERRVSVNPNSGTVETLDGTGTRMARFFSRLGGTLLVRHFSAAFFLPVLENLTCGSHNFPIAKPSLF